PCLPPNSVRPVNLPQLLRTVDDHRGRGKPVAAFHVRIAVAVRLAVHGGAVTTHQIHAGPFVSAHFVNSCTELLLCFRRTTCIASLVPPLQYSLAFEFCYRLRNFAIAMRVLDLSRARCIRSCFDRFPTMRTAATLPSFTNVSFMSSMPSSIREGSASVAHLSPSSP
ncbi:hypothetical protein PF007_g32356, partial [Phytophthora fragariae]